MTARRWRRSLRAAGEARVRRGPGTHRCRKVVAGVESGQPAVLGFRLPREYTVRISPSTRRSVAAIVALGLALSASILGTGAAHAAPPPPQIMVALGDSITRATMTCSTLSGCPANSWSTGTTSTVGSHYSRLLAAGATGLTAANVAVNGATSASLPAQADSARTRGAHYVTIEIGANDACTSTVGAMTPTETFRAHIRSALATLADSAAAPQIFVASIPNLLRMYDLNKSSATARFTWSMLRVCQSLLANPASTKPADVQRRAAVQQRVTEYNAVLADECSRVTNCRFDGYAIANLLFVKADISTRDYFHPSLAGQAKFAAVTWATTQWVRP